MSVKDTLGNNQWMKANWVALGALFPTEFAPAQQLYLRVGYGLKLLGVNWRTNDELVKCFVFFERAGVIERRVADIRRRTR